MLIFLYAQTCFGFFAKFLEDPTEFCSNEKNINELLYGGDCFNQQSLADPAKDLVEEQSFLTDSTKAAKEIISVREDLDQANKLSKTIITQSDLRKKQHEDFLKELEENKTHDKKFRFKQGLKQLAIIEDKIQQVSEIGCTSGTGQDCKQDKIARLEQLTALKLQMISANPILGNKHVDEFLKGKVEKNRKDKKDFAAGLSSCARNSGRSKKTDQQKKSCRERFLKDNKRPEAEISFPQAEFLPVLKTGLKDSIEATDKLKETHSKVIDDINNFKANRNGGQSQKSPHQQLKRLRDKIYDNKDLTLDYFIAAEAQDDLPTSYHCRLIKEHQLNESNTLINSVAVDLAILAIPVGAPFLVGRLALNANRIAKVGRNGVSANNITRNASLGIAAAEGTAIGIDTKLLTDEKKRCDEVLQKITQAGSVSDQSQSLYDECQEKIDTLTRNYITTLIGGGVGSIASIKSIAVTSQRKIAGINQAHLIGFGELGADGKTLARSGNYTKAQLIRKAKILKEAGFNKKEREILLREGVAGVDEEFEAFLKGLDNQGDDFGSGYDNVETDIGITAIANDYNLIGKSDDEIREILSETREEIHLTDQEQSLVIDVLNSKGKKTHPVFGKLPAKGRVRNKTLSDHADDAVRTYTSDSQRFNDFLRGKDVDIEEWEVDHLVDGLNQLPAHKGTTYRGLSAAPKDVQKIIKAFSEGNKEFSDPAFLSTSRSIEEATDFLKLGEDNAHIVFKIKGQTGRHVSGEEALSEDEVLFSPGTRFRMTDVKEKDGHFFVEMEEILD